MNNDPLAQLEALLTNAVDTVQSTVHQIRSVIHLATKEDLEKATTQIMSTISDYYDRVNAAYDQLGSTVDGLVTSVDGISKDIAFLKDTITKLQNSPGSVTPEDQALLDTLEQRINAANTKLASTASTVKALDEATEQPPSGPNGQPPVA